MRFFYTVWVDTDTQEHATTVIHERIDADEWYGFDYRIDSHAGPVSDATPLNDDPWPRLAVEWKHEVNNGDTRLGFWDWVGKRLGYE